jgi:hypothetical protein
MEVSFAVAKAALSKATWLGHTDMAARLALRVDASFSHIGAALHQQLNGHSTWQPLGFFSCKLEDAQAKWSAFDRELFACVEVSAIFSSYWKAGLSASSRTTSLWWVPWRGSLTHGQHANVDIWSTWPSSLLISSTWLGRRTWLLTPCPGLRLPPSLHLHLLLQWWQTYVVLLHASCPAGARWK